MQTRIALLEKALQEAQAAPAAISGIEMFLIVSGMVFWVLVLFAVVRYFVLRRADVDPDIPTFMQQGDFSRNATNTLSFSEMRAIEVKHPSVAMSIQQAPERRASRIPRRSGGGDPFMKTKPSRGGDTREGA